MRQGLLCADQHVAEGPADGAITARPLPAQGRLEPRVNRGLRAAGVEAAGDAGSGEREFHEGGVGPGALGLCHRHLISLLVPVVCGRESSKVDMH